MSECGSRKSTNLHFLLLLSLMSWESLGFGFVTSGLAVTMSSEPGAAELPHSIVNVPDYTWARPAVLSQTFAVSERSDDDLVSR